jgi:NADH dehydrogenase
MKVVVAGGSGFLGRHISRALMDAGHEVTVLSRTPEKVSAVAALAGARAVGGDVTDARSLDGTMDGADAVVGVVQFPNHPVEVPRKGLTYDRYDRQGTEHLLAAAAKAGVSRYFYVSGAGADKDSDKSWYRAKGAAEAAVIGSGMTWAALRPSWAYGPEDRALNRLAAIARRSPVVPQLGIAPQRIQPVSVDDISLAVRRTFDRDDAWGRVFEIGGPDVMTMKEVMQTMLDVIGKRRVIVPIPKWLAQLGTAPLVVLPKPPMTPQGIEFATQDGIVDTSDLQSILDVHPVGLREGLSRYMRP